MGQRQASENDRPIYADDGALIGYGTMESSSLPPQRWFDYPGPQVLREPPAKNKVSSFETTLPRANDGAEPSLVVHNLSQKKLAVSGQDLPAVEVQASMHKTVLTQVMPSTLFVADAETGEKLCDLQQLPQEVDPSQKVVVVLREVGGAISASLRYARVDAFAAPGIAKVSEQKQPSKPKKEPNPELELRLQAAINRGDENEARAVLAML